MSTVHIKHLIIAAAAVTTAAVTVPLSSAEARPSTRSFTCEGLKDYIYDRGAVVMNHKNSSLYRRFVDSVAYCRHPNNSTRYFKVPTRTGTCRVKICAERRSFFYD